MIPQLDRHSKTDRKLEMLAAVWAGNRIQCDERNVLGIGQAHRLRKDDFLGKDN